MPGFVVVALPNRAAWLTSTSPRKIWLMRAHWAALLLLASTVLWAAVSSFLPAKIDRWHVVGVWVFVVSLTVLVSCVVPAPVAPSLALVIAALATFGAIPWGVNVFYNPDLRATVWLIGVILAALGCLVYALVGEAGSRRGLQRGEL